MTLEDIVKGIFGGVNKTFSRGYSAAHDGWDIPAARGTAVRAVQDGTVSYARNAGTQPDKGASGWAIGGGNVVNLDIGKQLNAQYAHLDRLAVREGQKVRKGDIVGYVGSTGKSTGPHLHFGVLDKSINKMVDPVKALGGGVSGVMVDETTLKKAGISTDPTYKLTIDDSIKLGETIGLSGKELNTFSVSWAGKTIGALLSIGGDISKSGALPDIPVISDVGAAIADLGDLATKLVAYVLAIAFIITGLWLYSKSSGGIPQPEGVMS